jgi:membrane-bound lytic murein transglycosylase D
VLNKKILKAGSVILILFISVLRLKAGSTPGFINDTTEIVPAINTLISAPEIPLHHSIKDFVDDYAESNDELFEKIRISKSSYLNTIDKIFIQHNIPVELKYLAIVESKLKTDAASGVGAVGVWQFMPATAKRFGLKITSKYDERKHLWKSSVAAAKYLESLYGYFEDWLLVVAAYNSGPAPIFSAIKKSGSRNFWKLQNFLPKETRNHVKRFIATHYYFEGKGSLVTLGKTESEKYLKELEAFNSMNQKDDNENDPVDSTAVFSQLIAVLRNENDMSLILKK